MTRARRGGPLAGPGGGPLAGPGGGPPAGPGGGLLAGPGGGPLAGPGAGPGPQPTCKDILIILHTMVNIIFSTNFYTKELL